MFGALIGAAEGKCRMSSGLKHHEVDSEPYPVSAQARDDAQKWVRGTTMAAR